MKSTSRIPPRRRGQGGKRLPVLRRIGKYWPKSLPCPAKKSGHCTGDFADKPDGTCKTWRCKKCHRNKPYCFGVGSTELCNDCATK